MMSDQILLEARNISKEYPSQSGGPALTILNDVSLTVNRKSLISIVGASGSGKSTLLHILGGLDRPTQGQILFDGYDISTYSEDKLAHFRNTSIGFVFQFHHLLPEFTALENVFMPGLISGKKMEEIKTRASSLLGKLGLSHREQHRPAQLSGGEQQRVAVARALMNKPKIIMADEPTGNLDTKNTGNLLDTLLQIREEEQVALLMVTHDMNIAQKSEFTYRLEEGALRLG